VDVDQSPLGRTPRSNPATYTGVFNDIRNLFVELPEARIRGYKPGRFSFNVKGGRCEACSGNGYKTIEMNFLPDVFVPCEECRGKRYNRETLEVRFRGKSIADVLDMTINQAVEFFENVPNILNKIKVLQDVGLGYIKLGQPSTTLSGGESQRVKLATELSKRDTGKTFYILDEPTTGLHFEDIRVLLSVLNRLVDKGNTVVVIEHNLDVIKCADWIIDMGPEGGRGGGQLIFSGTPEDLVRNGIGATAPFLKKLLDVKQ
jgi:excinuclease ABC subunit A